MYKQAGSTAELGHVADNRHPRPSVAAYDQARAERIAGRLVALDNLGGRQFTTVTGIPRGTLARALDPDRGVKDTTYEQIEDALTNLENRRDGKPHTAVEQRLVTFEAEGLYGAARVVVSGSVEIADEIREQFQRLIRGTFDDSDS